MPTLFAEFVFNGVFERFPGLTVVGGEVGAGWVPFPSRSSTIATGATATGARST
jgi:hypothetical protein